MIWERLEEAAGAWRKRVWDSRGGRPLCEQGRFRALQDVV